MLKWWPMTKPPSNKVVSREIDKFLQKNPQLKEALKVFNMSNKEYKKAMEAVTLKPVNTTSSSTDYYGDLARNR